MTEPSMCGFDAAFLSNYFDNLLDFSDEVTTQLRCGGIFFDGFCEQIIPRHIDRRMIKISVQMTKLLHEFSISFC